jgi:2-keto-4-pentenoate hydratase
MDFQSEGVPDCVERVFLVIELHQYVTRSKNANAAELIANNVIHAVVVAGNGVKVPFKSGAPSFSSYRNDTLLDACSTEALITTMRSSLRWLMQYLNARDGELRAGEIILTGSLLGLYPLNETCRFRVESEPFGVVEAFIQY